jgi:hypothetical protein
MMFSQWVHNTFSANYFQRDSWGVATGSATATRRFATERRRQSVVSKSNQEDGPTKQARQVGADWLGGGQPGSLASADISVAGASNDQ